jgi:hypothetical protein
VASACAWPLFASAGPAPGPAIKLYAFNAGHLTIFNMAMFSGTDEEAGHFAAFPKAHLFME